MTRIRTGTACLAILTLVLAPTAWGMANEPGPGSGFFEPLGAAVDWLLERLGVDTDPSPSMDPPPDDPPPSDPPPPDPPDPDDEKGGIFDPGG